MEDPSNIESGQHGQHGHSDIPLVFMKESHLFGDRIPNKDEWISHVELYKAISNRIVASHISGLQRVGGLWRIYLDNVEDKVKLMAEGVPLRGKTIPVLNTNPQRPDGENTIRVRVKNIPLSADDNQITRTLTLRKADVISVSREKLRVNGRLTNCETGDRLVIIKANTLKEPLPSFMMFGMFKARVIHGGQKAGNQTEVNCSKCLQTGHKFSQCPNDFVCKHCHQSGHKQSECPMNNTDSTDESAVSDTDDDNERRTSDQTSAPKQRRKSPASDKRSASMSNTDSRSRKADANKGKPQQQSIQRFVNMSSGATNETPNKNRRGHAPERSPPTPVDVLQAKEARTAKSHKR